MLQMRHLVTAALSSGLVFCMGALGLASLAQAADAPAGSTLEEGALAVRYDVLLEQARALDVDPGQNPLAAGNVRAAEIRTAILRLGDDVAAAREEAREEAEYRAEGGTVNGVSLATLNAIAACESGGDPTAVNAAGYYGKYQFDLGTWASVGGSGNPAEASEAEQDYRAAVLYSRAGSSPWPICGA